jgi:hypothetical protein
MEKLKRCLLPEPRLFSSTYLWLGIDVHCHLGTSPWFGQSRATWQLFPIHRWRLATEAFPCHLRWQPFFFPFFSPLNWGWWWCHFDIHQENHVFLRLTLGARGWTEPWNATADLIMMPWASDTYLSSILWDPDNMGHSAALWAFQLITHVNYRVVPPLFWLFT